MQHIPRHKPLSIIVYRFFVSTALILLLASCANYEELSLVAFQQGNYKEAAKAAESWANKESANSLPHFILAVSYYFSGDAAQSDSHRRQALGNKDNIALISKWIEQLDLHSMPESHLLFIKGLQAEIDDDLDSALHHYTKALELEPEQQLFRFNVDAIKQELNPGKGYMKAGDGSMSRQDGIRYSGEMKLANNAWVPVEGAFNVSAGKVHSGLGASAFSASAGAWVYVKNKETDEIVSWAPTLTEGKLLIASQSATAAKVDSKNITIQADASYEHLPFDFQGRYKLIQLDKGSDHFYPIFHLDSYQAANQNYQSPKAYFGTELNLGAEHLLGGSNFRNGQIVIVCGNKKAKSFSMDIHLRGDFNIDESSLIKVPAVKKGVNCGHKTIGGKMYYFAPEYFRLQVMSGHLFGTIRSAIMAP